MRISTNQIYDQNIRSILNNQSDLVNTQEQLTTGKKLLKPSDDPVGAAKALRLTEELDSLTDYKHFLVKHLLSPQLHNHLISFE